MKLKDLLETNGHGPDVQDYEQKLDVIVNYLVTLATHEAKKAVQNPDAEHIKYALEVIEKDLFGKAANKLAGKQYQRSQYRGV